MGLAITALLVIVAISYHQIIQGFPGGGGSFIAAGENLGTLPGLVAASALLIDYLLTAAVSLTAGVAAIAPAFPELWSYRVELALFLLLIITLINLRGMQETGTLMAVPVYLFLSTYLLMLIYGAIRAIVSGPGDLAAAAPAPQEPLTLLLVLHAFSAGCTALTGIEAISNGVPAFLKTFFSCPAGDFHLRGSPRRGGSGQFCAFPFHRYHRHICGTGTGTRRIS